MPTSPASAAARATISRPTTSSSAALPLRERPLTVMELTLLDREYLGPAAEQAYERIGASAAICRRFNGRFSLLWHNNALLTARGNGCTKRSLRNLRPDAMDSLAAIRRPVGMGVVLP